jgi:hypothetical protein
MGGGKQGGAGATLEACASPVKLYGGPLALIPCTLDFISLFFGALLSACAQGSGTIAPLTCIIFLDWANERVEY